MLCGVGELTAIAGEGRPVSGGLAGTVEVASCASSDTEGRSEMVGVFPDGVVSGGMGVLCDPDVDLAYASTDQPRNFTVAREIVCGRQLRARCQ